HGSVSGGAIRPSSFGRMGAKAAAEPPGGAPAQDGRRRAGGAARKFQAARQRGKGPGDRFRAGGRRAEIGSSQATGFGWGACPAPRFAANGVDSATYRSTPEETRGPVPGRVPSGALPKRAGKAVGREAAAPPSTFRCAGGAIPRRGRAAKSSFDRWPDRTGQAGGAFQPPAASKARSKPCENWLKARFHAACGGRFSGGTDRLKARRDDGGTTTAASSMAHPWQKNPSEGLPTLS